MSELRSKLIRLAHANPHLRADLLPLIASRKQPAKKASHAKEAAPQIFEDWLEMFLDAVANSCGMDVFGEGSGQIQGSIDVGTVSLAFDRMGTLKFNITGLDYDDGDIEENGSIPFDKLKKMNPKAVGAMVKEAANKLQKRK